jgi:hypothetical protein
MKTRFARVRHDDLYVRRISFWIFCPQRWDSVSRPWDSYASGGRGAPGRIRARVTYKRDVQIIGAGAADMTDNRDVQTAARGDSPPLA